MKTEESLYLPGEGFKHTEIDMSHIRVGGGPVGLIFAIGTVCMFLAGIPALRWFFVVGIGSGSIIALALRIFHRHKPASF